MKKQNAVWTTKEGKKIRVCDMSDSHLNNTIAFLERTVHAQEVQIAFHMLEVLHGEMALMSAESYANSLDREDHMEAIDKMFPDGYIILYTCPDSQLRMSLYNPHRDITIEKWHQLLKDSMEA